MLSKKVIYRFFDDQEEKHYVSTSLEHHELENLVEEYKSRKEKIVAKEFIDYLKSTDPEAKEVEVKDFYF